MKVKSNKKSKLTTFFIILFLIFGFLQVINSSRNNQIFKDIDLFNDESGLNINIAATIGSDWEINSGTGEIALISKPNNTQEGDLLIFHCTIDGEGPSITDPIGWTDLLPENQSGGQTTASWYKIAGVSEPISYNVTWVGSEDFVAGIIRITGHDETNPIQTTATVIGTGDIISPSVTTTKDDTLIIGFHGLDRRPSVGDNYTGTLESGPTALYSRISRAHPSACSAGIYYETQADQGTSSTRTWGIGGGDDWYAATVAINSPLYGINIIDPTENEVFGGVAPNFTVEITIPDLDSMWYTLDGGLNNHTFAENETINQAAWDALEDGGVTIRFYANNTLGDINFKQVNVIKDTLAPIINIVSPVENEIFGVSPPSFILEITDLNLDTMWYSIYNNTHQSLNITFIDNETIDSMEWDAIYDGVYTFRFDANDTLGNINFKEVNITKDKNAIIFNITNPTENEIYGVVAPNFIVEISGTNKNTTWYTLDGGINNYTFTENETVNQVAWSALPDGKVTIRFYVNNSMGNKYFKQVNIIKDSSTPTIDIISPIENETFGVNPPNFVVEITDLNLDTMWYSIYNNTHQSLNLTFTDNGTIDPTEWGALYDGTYTIRFYANNSIGNVNFEEVDVIKYMYAIVINIHSPAENEIYGDNAPSFIVEFESAFLNTTWYTLNGALKKFIFTENGTINQTTWITLQDGVVTIGFYSNNSLGEIYFKQVNVIKDTTAPTINIISPTTNEVFGVAAPSFSVEIIDSNLDTMGYWIFNSSYQSLNVSFTDNGTTIDQTEWDTLSNGDYTIRFYANDTIGNIDFEDVNVTKDIYAIFIEISNPIENEIFGVNAPNFIVKITCAFLNITWYTIDGGLNNFTFTENETINEAAWDALSDDVINIRFYANNSLGDINFKQVNVIKDASAPTINIINPSENEIFRVDAPSFSVVITDPNLDTMWYTVNNSAAIFIFTQDGVIDQTAWDGQANGDVILIFYANDTLGNIASENVIIRKSTPSGAGPDITPIIVLVSVITVVAVTGVTLGILIKQGKISLDKISIRKPSTGKSKTDTPPKVRIRRRKTKKEKTPAEEKSI